MNNADHAGGAGVEREGRRFPLRTVFTLKFLVPALFILLVVFLLGYIPPSTASSQLEGENARLRQHLALSDLLGTLGLAGYEAHRGNYADASKRSTQFFDGLRNVAERSDDSTVRRQLESTLGVRDEITSMLARRTPDVRDRLMDLYGEFARVARSSSATSATATGGRRPR